MAQAVTDKIRQNTAKYPADRCRGSADKYTAYASQEEGSLKAVVTPQEEESSLKALVTPPEEGSLRA